MARVVLVGVCRPIRLRLGERSTVGQDHSINEVARGLLEAISHAVRVLDGQGRVEEALGESFRMAARGLGAERAFLAHVGPQREFGAVLESEGLSEEELRALGVGRSSPGLSVSVVRKVLESGRAHHVEDTRLVVTDLNRTAALEGGEWSVVCAPVVDPYTGAPLAILYLQTHSITRPLTQAVLPHVRSYAAALSHAWHSWKQARREGESVRAELSATTRAGQERGRVPEIIGGSQPTRALRAHLERVVVPAMAAARPDPILILGPTGTGKELVARYLHASSPRARERFVALNCATLRGDLVEATLFGYVKGSFTGAAGDSDGLFVMASGGVLFLDEVGDMPAQGQSTLLRVLESRSVRPVGGREERSVDVQLMCATHVDLHKAVRAGRFRADLYHRIRGLCVRIQPLSERREDVTPLVSHFLAHHQRRLGRSVRGLTPEAVERLQRYEWPGNVREVSHVCSSLVLHTPPGEPIAAEAVKRVLSDATDGDTQPAPAGSLEELLDLPYRSWAEALSIFERIYLERVAVDLRWNRSAIARRLQIDRKSAYRRMKRYGLAAPWADDDEDGAEWEEQHDERR